MGEDISTRFDRLDNEIQELNNQRQEHEIKIERLETYVDFLKGKNLEIYVNHILGQCISDNLVKRINILENENYNDWYDIPDNILNKHGFTRNKLLFLKKPRNLQCRWGKSPCRGPTRALLSEGRHPYITISDIEILLGHFRFTAINNDIEKLVLFIYDPQSKTFK